jgi:hypothetical protein
LNLLRSPDAAQRVVRGERRYPESLAEKELSDFSPL